MRISDWSSDVCSSDLASIQVHFDDNRLLPLLYGEHDKHLAQIERKLGISLISRSNHLAISGPSDSTDVARVALRKLYRDLKRGHVVDAAEIEDRKSTRLNSSHKCATSMPSSA